ncbi:hypothetical protein B0T22DRAFT_274461 [Podospora appendiculata]|uniref:Cytochrome P450 n=1 Tax=Podospora appendiculata TaxID=314037 RepID=A0AAE0X449_9PEZI|nr:hypothetical protein B0T22DRAFT_274461 [Podospora appendiculata]
MFPAILALGILALTALLVRAIHHRPQKPSETPTVENWLASQHAIVTFAYAGPNLPREQKLLLRSQPNSRLVAAFGIDNSLTTASVEVHDAFRRAAAKLVGNHQARWLVLYQAAEGIVSDWRQIGGASEADGARRLRLAEGVRCLCFRVVLVDVFGKAVGGGGAGFVGEGEGEGGRESQVDGEKGTKEDEDLVVVITKEINNQWVESKRNENLPRSKVLEDGLKRLKLVLPDGDGVPLTPEEALGLIMPQYETLWRVVLLTFVTAFHRVHGKAREEITRRTEGVPGCLGDSEKEKSALGLAKEGLRLFPSNKRIYRTGSEPADLERCHRRAEIWGDDALEFRPERFDSLTDLQKQAYFPFSIGQHKCPAYAGFGDRMVTMLVVVLGRMLSADVGVVVFDDEELDADGGGVKPLPTGRDDMEGWVLELL